MSTSSSSSPYSSSLLLLLLELAALAQPAVDLVDELDDATGRAQDAARPRCPGSRRCRRARRRRADRRPRPRRGRRRRAGAATRSGVLAKLIGSLSMQLGSRCSSALGRSRDDGHLGLHAQRAGRAASSSISCMRRRISPMRPPSSRCLASAALELLGPQAGVAHQDLAEQHGRARRAGQGRSADTVGKSQKGLRLGHRVPRPRRSHGHWVTSSRSASPVRPGARGVAAGAGFPLSTSSPSPTPASMPTPASTFTSTSTGVYSIRPSGISLSFRVASRRSWASRSTTMPARLISSSRPRLRR